MTIDPDTAYWYNLKTAEAEYGRVSPAVYRAGPFETREEAERAPETLAENARRWAEDDQRDADER